MTAPVVEKETSVSAPADTGSSGESTAGIEAALDNELAGNFEERESDILEPGAPGAAFGEPENTPEPVQAAPVVSAAVVPEPVAEPTSVPLKYQVDGAEQTLDWAEEVPGEGILIDNAHRGKFLDIVQGHQHMRGQVHHLTQEAQRFQAAGGWDRVSELVGREAVFSEVGKILLDLLDPKGPQDERGLPAKLARLTESAEARELLSEKLNNLTEQADFRARQKFQSTVSTQMQERQSAQTEAGIVPYAVGELARAVKQTYGVDLTPDDLKEVTSIYAKHGAQMYRLPTPQEAQQLRVPVTQRIVDYSVMHPWFEARGVFRQREAQSAKATATAGTENTQRLAQSTPTRPANKTAAIQPPGTGQRTPVPAPTDKKPDWGSTKRQMLRGVPLVP